MGYQKWREEFISNAARQGMLYYHAVKMLRSAQTLGRLAVAQCNGDYPADNGERKVAPCPKCETLWVPHTIKKNGCPDCRAEASARKNAPEGWTIETGGDPRGCVLTVISPNGVRLGVPDAN